MRLFTFLLACTLAFPFGAQEAPAYAATGPGSPDDSAAVVTFSTGSLIIPMDTGTNGQNSGMLRAYGLVYALLTRGVPVNWVINPSKSPNGDDFSIPVVNGLQDVRTGATVTSPRSYRGGPFVIAAADTAVALPVIQAWQAAAGDVTAVHRYTGAAGFSGDVARLLVGAPRLAELKDGNEAIAFNNLNAAGITDALGGTWTAASPDLLTEADVKGLTSATDDDGALFILTTVPHMPRYCHLTSMHYNTTIDTPEVVQETRQWLDRSDLVHMYGQCESARVFENTTGGLYLTNAGLDDDGSATATPSIRVPAHPLTQLDGVFAVDSGSVDSMRANDASGATPDYKTGVQTLINDNGAPLTQRITLLTGRLDGDNSNGRVTWLAGHNYALDLPITSNPQTNGVRLFLNSIFESDCALSLNQPDVLLIPSAPAEITSNPLTTTISYSNPGPRPAENIKLTYTLPPGTTFVSATGNGTFLAGAVSWLLPPLPTGTDAPQSVTVTVPAPGTYTGSVRMQFAHLLTRDITVSVTTNTAPTASSLSATENYFPGTPINLIDIVVTDVGAATITATLTLSTPTAGSLSTATSGAVTSTFHPGTGVWSASGPLADVNTLLAGVAFIPAAGYSANFSIFTDVSDGFAAPLTGTKPMIALYVGSVPDRLSLGSPLLVSKNGANPAHLDFTWGDSCGLSQSDFVLYQGTIGLWYSHSSTGGCSTGNNLFVNDFMPADLSTYYLVVALSTAAEGSYGRNSSGAEIPQGGSTCRAARDLTSCP